jgi:Flp pilus assembly protein TadG
MNERRRAVEHERGSASVELAVIAPALVILMLLVVYAGRAADTDALVTRAAGAAARAASLRQHPTDAAADAHATATENLASAGIACDPLDVDVDLADFRAGGTVTVTVSCHVPNSDMALLGLPGTRTFTATSVEVIDRYRSSTTP